MSYPSFLSNMSIDQLCQIFSKMKLVDQQLHGDTEKSGDESKPNWEHHNFGWHIDQQLLHGGGVSVQRLLAMKPRKPPAKPSDPRCVCCHRCGDKGHLAAKCSSGGERCFCCGKLQLHSSDECPNRHPGSFGKGLKCWNCGGAHKMTRCNMPRWCNTHNTWHNRC